MFLSFDEDAVTVAADSRMTILGQHEEASNANTGSKIFPFRTQFIFAIVDAVSGQY